MVDECARRHDQAFNAWAVGISTWMPGTRVWASAGTWISVAEEIDLSVVAGRIPHAWPLSG
ncbi:MAG TPA: hypothetical protein VLK82_21900 [Candidatus Tectomicrobia bacterium]|nr:hypothetical protein [Candidatus Tectomicrobia bacterium]